MNRKFKFGDTLPNGAMVIGTMECFVLAHWRDEFVTWRFETWNFASGGTGDVEHGQYWGTDIITAAADLHDRWQRWARNLSIPQVGR